MVTARDAGNAILAQNQFEYDDRRHLAREFQSHEGAVTGSTPKVDYAWEFSPNDEYNFDRLVSLTAPQRPEGGDRRALTFNYGNNTDNIDSAVCVEQTPSSRRGG